MAFSKDPTTYSEELWTLVDYPERFTFPILLGPMPARTAQRWRFNYYGFLNALRTADERARRRAQQEHAVAIRQWQGQGGHGTKPELSLPYVCEVAQRADFFDKRYILRVIGGPRRGAPAGDEPTYLKFEERSISDVGLALLALAKPSAPAALPVAPGAPAPAAQAPTIDPYEAFMQLGRDDAAGDASAPGEDGAQLPTADTDATGDSEKGS